MRLRSVPADPISENPAVQAQTFHRLCQLVEAELAGGGWVRLSPFDTWWGYMNRGHAGETEGAPEAWMLIRADDVGELLREMVLDGTGQDVEDDAWLPELF